MQPEGTTGIYEGTTGTMGEPSEGVQPGTGTPGGTFGEEGTTGGGMQQDDEDVMAPGTTGTTGGTTGTTGGTGGGF